MTDQEQSFERVNRELRSFGRRFYLNELLQGLAIFVIASLLLLLFLSLGEYLLRNDKVVRKILFSSFLVSEIIGFVVLFFLPLLRMYGKAGAKTDVELSLEVGKRMNSIEDKLHNILILSRMNDGNRLLQAAIHQKSQEVLKIPFHESASFKRGLRFMRWAGIGMLLIILMGMSFPDVVNYGTKRIIYFEKDLQPPAPFEFILKHEPMHAVVNESMEIDFSIKGEYLPKEVFINIGETSERVKKAGMDNYTYLIRRVTGDFKFYLTAEGYRSPTFEVNVLERPIIDRFEIVLDYPSYLNRRKDLLKNMGNVSVPEGTLIEWRLFTELGDQLSLEFGKNSIVMKPKSGEALFDSVFYRSSDYSLSAFHENGLSSDTINYQIEVIVDEYPEIEVSESRDSLNALSTFVGRFSDDHGITLFRLAYSVNGGNEIKYENIERRGTKRAEDFAYQVNWKNWELKDGDKVSCYFEVWDNDGVNGNKPKKSRTFYFELPDKDALKGKRDELSDDIEKELMDALKESEELNKEIEELRKDLIQKRSVDWVEKKRAEELLKRNEDLRQKMEEIRRKNNEKNKFEDELSRNPELQRKREELQRLMDEILDEEMMEKIKELEELMEKISKERLNEELEEMEISNEQLENELDRSLELFRQLEFEMKLQESLDKLDELQKTQEEIQENTEDKANEDNLSETQRENLKEFNKLEESLEELREMNKSLEKKHDVEDFGEEREKTNESMEESADNLEKGRRKRSMENQEKAMEEMQKMEEGLQMMMSSMAQQQTEDLQSLRNTLENLLELSFNQEKVMNEMAAINGDNPRFNDLTKEQRSVLSGLEVVEDSLLALSKRVPEIKPTINRELGKSKQNMNRSLKSMTERKLGSMAVYQQNAMTSLNNLALLLDEVVDQLQQQMMQSSGQCQNPGQSKPSSSSMKGLQKQLNQQLEDMKKMMEQQGKGEGKEKNGGKPGNAEQLARMAAEQAKIREELRRLEEGANQEESGRLRKIGEMMEETERDIVNREITRETLMRQEEILTNLLESEKAERQRDMKEERESDLGNNDKKGNLLDLEQYYKAREADHEGIIKENISFNRFYSEKAEKYFKNLSE